MKILSVQQPWAWAILHAGKNVENRTWPTKYRGPLLIHAGVSKARLGDFGEGEPDRSLLAFGAIVGVVELVDCLPLDQLPEDLRGRFASGPWCWILANPRPFTTPITCKGQVGLFNPPAGFCLADHLPTSHAISPDLTSPLLSPDRVA